MIRKYVDMPDLIQLYLASFLSFYSDFDRGKPRINLTYTEYTPGYPEKILNLKWSLAEGDFRIVDLIQFFKGNGDKAFEEFGKLAKLATNRDRRGFEREIAWLYQCSQLGDLQIRGENFDAGIINLFNELTKFPLTKIAADHEQIEIRIPVLIIKRSGKEGYYSFDLFCYLHKNRTFKNFWLGNKTPDHVSEFYQEIGVLEE